MLRTRLAVAAGKATRLAARLRGGGSALPGLVVERIDPRFLAHALSGMRDGVVVVTGTNGKTTTTRMLVALLRAHGRRVVTNPTGSNFTRGVISSILGELPAHGRLDADVAVLELDEAHALRFADVVRPTHALLLNVARDQLDRFAEIDHTADLLARLGTQARQGVVLNRDDPFVARIAADVDVPVTYFGLHPDVADTLLPDLQEADVRYADAPDVAAVGAGDGLLAPVAVPERPASSFAVEFGDGTRVGPVELQQRGIAAMINATAATTAARRLLGASFSPDTAAQALRRLAPPFGRGEVVDVDGAPLELVLVKNPAGFRAALTTYGASPVATMIAINDNIADGTDVSWLYDVNVEALRDAGVSVCSGVRAFDMALRLRYDGVATREVVPDLGDGLDAFLGQHRGEPTRLFCTYTAMMAVRKTLSARYGLAAFGEEARS